MPVSGSVDIYVLITGGHLQCTTYLLSGAEARVLVDPGSGTHEQQILEAISRVGHNVNEITHALLTHCHVDHARGAYRFRSRGVSLVASPLTAQALRSGSEEVWYEYPEYVIPTEVDVEVGDGQRLILKGMEIISVHTPGHTPGCTSYIVETRDGLCAFTGDLLVGEVPRPGWAGSAGFSLESTLRSVEKLIALRPQKIYTGHGVIGMHAVEWLNDALAMGSSGAWPLSKERHPDVKPPGFFERGKR